jgi:hypothetical protein
VRSRVATRSTTEETARKNQPKLAKLAHEAAKLLGAESLAARELKEAADEVFEVGHPPPLSKATRKILNSIKPTWVLPIKGISPRDRYIFDSADIYERFLGKIDGGKKIYARVLTVSGKKDKGGPFIRFVQEAASQYGISKPSGSAIASALRKRDRCRIIS